MSNGEPMAEAKAIEEHCRFMADALPYPVWILDQTGGLRHANRHVWSVAGRAPQQTQEGASGVWDVVVHADDRAAFKDKLAQSLEAGVLCAAEIQLGQAGGESYRWHAVSAAPIRDDAQRIVLWFVTAMDIHQKKVEEENLREREARYRLLTETSNDGAFYWDAKTNHVFWTDRQLQLLGLTHSDWEGTVNSFINRIHPDDAERAMRIWKAHLERREPYLYEVRLRHKSGEYRTCQVRGQAEWDENGVPLRMGGGLADISDRKRMEEELREKLAIIERQQEAISKLSSPIIEVWDGVLTMPVLGTVDTNRATQMMETLLNHVVATRCKYAILDLTGLDSLDTSTADHIIKIIRAVQLLGAHGVVVGIKPEAAQTIVAVGVDLAHVTTLANLREALLFCMRGGTPKSATRTR